MNKINLKKDKEWQTISFISATPAPPSIENQKIQSGHVAGLFSIVSDSYG